MEIHHLGEIVFKQALKYKNVPKLNTSRRKVNGKICRGPNLPTRF